MDTTLWESTEMKDVMGGTQFKASSSEIECGLGVNVLYCVNATVLQRCYVELNSGNRS